ncbi:glycoside hydrolase family 18 protein [Serpula lacrymans var. lacrymans S7.9]|uniref:Glycoside hydrolase family 18 protein n=1 Tax=Serpula lacrymans var. lacrymans (strain S7.9) TaxID=578457 RepID=F8NUZ5_SERL9|nr:glycoside hydrolase family 18 protein [Serpula lacrymans var. lacrymans S7.9]EGO25950.1 glycoside hydrolase family 18 protein [Serpula lacrymans var. lacrymans S7.9]
MLSILYTALPLLLALPFANAGPSSKRGGDDLVLSAWYAGWHATVGFPLSNVSWDKYTNLVYSFAITTPDVTKVSLNGSDGELLPQFVSEAHEHGIQAFAAIGGWGGAQYFSTAVASAENRTTFVKTIVDFAEEYHLDGINFDWEYPNVQGIGCNTLSPNDTANFLSFLQELRQDPVGANLVLSAATAITPFAGPDGSPSTNVSGFADVLDYIQVMNYDIWGPWSTAVGPNSPLNDTCAPAADRVGSAVSAVAAWTAAGIPKSQIVLGVASYGHSFSVPPTDAFVNGSKTELVAFPAFNASNQPLGDPWDDTGSVDACGVYEGPGGDWDFWGLIWGGFLTTEGKPAEGIYYRYDECSQTPYVYNETSEVMVSYDNVQSFAVKGTYIKETGLRGFAIWEAGGDYNDMLLDSIRSTIGI